MSRKNIKPLKYRRRREGRTNYKKRMSLLKSNLPRLVIRKSNKHIYAQIVEYIPNGDKVIVSSCSLELKKLGWNFGPNMSTAYLVGFLLGKKAVQHKVKDSIPDFGLSPSIKGSKLYAVLKGTLDAGLSVRHSEDVLPDEDRLNGKHITDYFKNKSKENASKEQFGSYVKLSINPEKIPELIEQTKTKITGLVK